MLSRQRIHQIEKSIDNYGDKRGCNRTESFETETYIVDNNAIFNSTSCITRTQWICKKHVRHILYAHGLES